MGFVLFYTVSVQKCVLLFGLFVFVFNLFLISPNIFYNDRCRNFSLPFFNRPDVKWLLIGCFLQRLQTQKKTKTTQCVRWKLKELETRGCGETT